MFETATDNYKKVWKREANFFGFLTRVFFLSLEKKKRWGGDR